MHDSADFTLRITVTAPERQVDDYAPTTPFERPAGIISDEMSGELPRVTARRPLRPQAPQQPPRPMQPRLRAVPSAPTLQAEAPLYLPKVVVDPPRVMAPSIPSPTLVRTPAARPAPLSEDEELHLQ